MTNHEARAVAMVWLDLIDDNAEDYYAGAIDYGLFDGRNRSAWESIRAHGAKVEREALSILRERREERERERKRQVRGTMTSSRDFEYEI